MQKTVRENQRKPNSRNGEKGKIWYVAYGSRRSRGTSRKWGEGKIHNICKATADLERHLLQRLDQWRPNYDWVPRPMSSGTRFLLVLYSGHRRYADIASWVKWQSDIQPICIDLAIDANYGDCMNDKLWRDLIASTRVTGAHAAPPCETYTLARWLEPTDSPAPRPLRDSSSPGGREFLTLSETAQCHTGTVLMFRALHLLLLTHCFGGSISLEHPKGADNHYGRWTIRDSALLRQLLLLPEVQRVDFIQGPLGQPFTKPRSMLVGRMNNFAHVLFRHHQSNWKPTEWLGGKEKGSRSWRTAKAKAYLPLLCKVIAEMRLAHAASLKEDGEESLPEKLQQALQALDSGFDPYMPSAKGTKMAGDYWSMTSTGADDPIFFSFQPWLVATNVK